MMDDDIARWHGGRSGRRLVRAVVGLMVGLTERRDGVTAAGRIDGREVGPAAELPERRAVGAAKRAAVRMVAGTVAGRSERQSGWASGETDG